MSYDYPVGPGFVVPHGYELDLALESVGPGWASLVREAFEKKPDGILIQQVKEKFGALRIYPDRYTDEYREVLNDLEARSAMTCERCGQPGRTDLWGRGWYLTLCDEHGEERRNS